HVADPADDALADKLLILLENNQKDAPLPLISTKPSRQFEFIAYIERLNALNEQEKKELSDKTNAYFEKLAQLDVDDMGVAQTKNYNWATFLALIIGFIPFIIGLVTNFIPTRIPKMYADKNIKQPKFYASVQVGMGAVLYNVYFWVLLIIAAIWGNIWWILFVCSFPLLGILTSIWRKYAANWNEARKVSQLDKKTINDLREMRAGLVV
ncbi:MAG: hypothetical protein AB8G86_01590, partial [Saprospiraceae bacterium]